MRKTSTFLLILVSVSGATEAERRQLDPPDLIEFQPLQYVSADYRQNVADLGRLMENFNSEILNRNHQFLLNTLDQVKLLDAVSKIIKEAESADFRAGYRGVKGEAREELRNQAASVKEHIANNSYLGDNYPIEVEIDAKKRVYVAKWRDWTGENWTGDYVTRVIPFVPTMRVRVFGFYSPLKEGGSYHYRIENAEESKKPTRHFWIECLGLTQERLALLAAIRSSRSVKNGGLIFDLGFPARGYLQDFRIFAYKGQTVVEVKPGESLTIPPILSVPWDQLPGVVRVWADAWGYQPGLSENDPEILIEVFGQDDIVPTPETGSKKVPVYMYQGKTIGPVPVPGPEVSAGQFLETIRGYFQDAREWGWCPDLTTAEEIEQDLEKLTAGDIRREELLRLVDKVEAAHRRQELLEEAYVLLKFNLEYLAKNKIPQ